MTRVSVIVPTWNAGSVLGACLESLERQRVEGGFETIVVDNASTDDTQQVLERFAGRVRVIASATNEGFSAANNKAAEVASGGVLFFLNSDTEVLGDDALERLARTVEQPGVAIAGPRLVNPDGSLQPSCAGHPSVSRALLVTAGVPHVLPDRLLPRADPERWSHDRARDVPWVKGAAMAVRADVFRELGGFWPALYGEEQDLALRAEQRGLRVRFEPSARVMHIGNHSLRQRLTSADRAERVAQAEVLFLRSHYPRSREWAIRAITGAGFAARAALHAALRRPERAVVYRTMARVYRRGGEPERAPRPSSAASARP